MFNFYFASIICLLPKCFFGFCGFHLFVILGCSRNNPHPPMDGIREILVGRGVKDPWKFRREGGLNSKKSSAGVISPYSSRDSNV